MGWSSSHVQYVCFPSELHGGKHWENREQGLYTHAGSLVMENTNIPCLTSLKGKEAGYFVLLSASINYMVIKNILYSICTQCFIVVLLFPTLL